MTDRSARVVFAARYDRQVSAGCVLSSFKHMLKCMREILIPKSAVFCGFQYKVFGDIVVELTKCFCLCHGSHVVNSKPETKLFQILQKNMNWQDAQ